MPISSEFKNILIPVEIWFNKSISLQAKILWSEIWSHHDSENDGCYASNEYLADIINLSRSRLYEVLKELRDNGLIQDVCFDGRQKVVKAVIPKKVIV